jgi:Fe-S-cluster containining protein
MSNVNEKGHNESSRSELCLSCGLCCKGLIFNRVAVRPDETEMAEDLELHCFPSGDGKFAIRLPCPLFKGERCSIYSNRFDACKKYRCDLLKRLIIGDLSLLESKRMVIKTKNIMSSISQRMTNIEQLNINPEPHEDFRQRIIKALDFLCRNPMICKDTGELLRDIEGFLIILHDYIDKRAD